MNISKRGLVIALVILLAFPLVLAQNETEAEKSYSCLKSKLSDDCGNTQSTKEAAFNLLAMAHDSSVKSDCKSSLESKKSDNCWGETSSAPCDIKSTSLAILALDYIGENTDTYKDWLLSKKKIADELEWFLEVDTNNRSTCTINGNEITLQDNKKITGSNPPGLRKAYSDYWLEIIDFNINYTISCDKDFITTLIYKKPDESVYHVSSETHSASAGDSTEEGVNAYCFALSGACNYEGSLWATLALGKLGEETTPYIPYISAMAEESENRKYFPSTFLYNLIPVSDYYDDLLDKQKLNKYWDESGNKYFDTALALLALKGTGVTDTVKNYLLTIRESDNCWRFDTAFILHSGWPKISSGDGDDGSADGCVEFSHYCVSSGECTLSNTLDNFQCALATDVCCSEEPEEESCIEQTGVICESNEACDGVQTSSSDINCCLGTCEEIDYGNDCEDSGYSCENTCSKNQEEKTAYSDDCGYQICCAEKQSSPINWFLIILLIILIILVILAIIFRNQLKIWWFKLKSKFSSKKKTQPPKRAPPPGMMPQRPIRHLRRAPNPRAPPRRQIRRPPARDKDFDDTMKKLRDMSK